MDNTVSRRQAREQAFQIGFEKTFSDCSLDEILETAEITRDFTIDPFALEIVNGIATNKEEIDSIINDYTNGWKLNRLSRVSLSLLRIAIYEIKFSSNNQKADNPVSVAINEAVRLSKKYSTQEDSAFVNGVLGKFSKDVQK